MQVTELPLYFIKAPILLGVIPLPRPDIETPHTIIYFIINVYIYKQKNNKVRVTKLILNLQY